MKDFDFTKNPGLVNQVSTASLNYVELAAKMLFIGLVFKDGDKVLKYLDTIKATFKGYVDEQFEIVRHQLEAVNEFKNGVIKRGK